MERVDSVDAAIRGSDDTMSANAADRLISLDVFRGLTIGAMVLVNNPGTWSAIYDPLEHAAWHGWTFTDHTFSTKVTQSKPEKSTTNFSGFSFDKA